MNRFDYERIPEHMMQSLKAYVSNNSPVGSFLSAILANDLMGAVGSADDTNVELIPMYACWVQNNAPQICHGNYELVNMWVKKGVEV